MALTPSKEIAKNFKAKDFSLKDVISEKIKTLDDVKSEKALVIIFMCNHCPYVQHLLDKLIEVAREYIAKGVSFVGINSNDVKNYPEDSPEIMQELATELELPFPYLFDETQDVAKAYDAACTPEFFIFDKNLNCVYHGQFDDSRPGNNLSITGNDLKKALDQILAGKDVFEEQKSSIGCNIKWKEKD